MAVPKSERLSDSQAMLAAKHLILDTYRTIVSTNHYLFFFEIHSLPLSFILGKKNVKFSQKLRRHPSLAQYWEMYLFYLPKRHWKVHVCFHRIMMFTRALLRKSKKSSDLIAMWCSRGWMIVKNLWQNVITIGVTILEICRRYRWIFKGSHIQNIL